MTNNPYASVLRANTTSTSRENLNFTNSLTCKQYLVYSMDPNFQEKRHLEKIFAFQLLNVIFCNSRQTVVSLNFECVVSVVSTRISRIAYSNYFTSHEYPNKLH